MKAVVFIKVIKSNLTDGNWKLTGWTKKNVTMVLRIRLDMASSTYPGS